VDLIAKRIQIIGSPVGSQQDLADVVKLAEEGKIHPVIETYPVEKVNDALARMRYGKVRFRAVLTF
jgi:D-arabinose 1-dehydrogenase-like Zn-dependent alcohol dehydrogenase